MTTETPRITVTGEAAVLRKPDVAYITLYLRSDGILLEDAVREADGKVDQIKRALRETYDEIEDIQVKDVHVGESKSAVALRPDKGNPGRPEVITGVLVVVPAKQDLAVNILDTACRMGCVMGNPAGHLGGPAASSAILYALSEPADAEEDALTRAIANAKQKALLIANKIEKRVGSVHHANVMLFPPDDMMTRRSRSPLLPRIHHLSASAENVEVISRISVSFDLD